MFIKKIKNKKAFTLLELLVVIAIIGVLASIVMSSLNSSRNKADTAFVKQQADQIKKQMELYYQQNGNYGYYNSNMNIASNYQPAGYAGYTNFPGGAGDCYAPFARQGVSDTPGTVSHQIALMVGRAMQKTNSATFWCYISPDQQSYAFAFYSMKSGLNTYCVDSSGKVKESTTSYLTTPIGSVVNGTLQGVTNPASLTSPVLCL
jgi:type IV pilus assembly protein PilA